MTQAIPPGAVFLGALISPATEGTVCKRTVAH